MVELFDIVRRKRAALLRAIMPMTAALFLLFCAGVARVGYAQDLEVEPNATSSQATPISSGKQVQGSFFDRTDRDYFKLTLSSRQEVTVGLSTTPSSNDTYSYSGRTQVTVEIFNASLSKIGGFTIGSAAPVDTKLIAGPGDVFILVRDGGGFNFDGGLKYLLTISVANIVTEGTVELEPNGTTAQATPVSAGKQIQGSFFDRSDRDYYKLSLIRLQI
jgi:hypothetical protein